MKTNGKEILIHIVLEKYATKRHRIPVMHKVQKQLLVLNRNLQSEIFTGIKQKYHSGISQQINNSIGWYQNVSLVTFLSGVKIIDTRFLPRIVDCIGILQDSGTWTDRDQAEMVNWCRQFLDNVQNRVDHDHMHSGHNIASWYHVQMVSLALLTDNIELANGLLKRTKAWIDTA